MTEVAQIYLGNISDDPNLARMIAAESFLEVALQSSDRSKGRIHAHTNSDLAVGIIKSRDRALRTGDLFKTESDKLLLIKLQEQELLVLDFSAVEPDIYQAKLVQLGHALGNHHYPIMLQENKIYVQLITDKQIIEKLIGNLNIIGLQIKYKMQSEQKKIVFSSHSH